MAQRKASASQRKTSQRKTVALTDEQQLRIRDERIQKYTTFEEWPLENYLDDSEKALRAASYLMRFAASNDEQFDNMDLMAFSNILTTAARNISRVASNPREYIFQHPNQALRAVSR